MTLKLMSLAAVAVFALSGCASHMTKPECESTDFYKMGLSDGRDGKGTDQLNKATGECQALGVTVPADKYNYGRTVGLTEYCDDSRAKNDAEKGHPSSVCSTVPPYTRAYSAKLDGMQKDELDKLKDLHDSQKALDEKELKIQSDMKKLEEQKRENPVPN